jgi:hypothetical protein
MVPRPLGSGPLAGGGPGWCCWSLVFSAALLALGTIVVFPFEMGTIIMLSDNRLVATYYGLYNTVCGRGIMLGNLLTGTALDLDRAAALPALALAGIGLLCATSVSALDRAGGLQRPANALTSA